MKSYEVVELGNVPEFENRLFYQAEMEKQVRNTGLWMKLLEVYVRQREIIAYSPFPESDENSNEDELIPSIKLIERNINPCYENELYRWGLNGFRVGNFRIIFCIYDYHKVLLLHAFDKQYNGDIKKEDIQIAEDVYEDYLNEYPSKYF